MTEDQPTKRQIDTLERIANCQNNLLIPLTDEERTDVHHLVAWLRSQARRPEWKVEVKGSQS